MGDSTITMTSSLLCAFLCGICVAGALEPMTEPSLPPAAAKWSSLNVFWRGQQSSDGTTYPCIRIPSIVFGSNGGVEAYLAFAECRRDVGDGCYPDGVTGKGATDLCFRVSSDYGASWTPLRVLESGASQPTAMWDPQHEQTLVQYVSNGHNMQTISRDLGQSWSAPEQIDTKWPLAAQGSDVGPGTGVQLSSKNPHAPRRNIFIGHHGAYQHDLIWYSDDDVSYTLANTSQLVAVDEGTLVELQNGDVLANMRSKSGHRMVSISNDGGLTWSAVHADTLLPDPACQGSLLGIDDSPDLYFSNPGTLAGRLNGTVWYSPDATSTWTPHVTVNPGGKFAYSCLTTTEDADSIGLLWETSTDGCSDASTSCSIIFSKIPTASTHR